MIYLEKAIEKFYWVLIVISIYPLYGIIFRSLAAFSMETELFVVPAKYASTFFCCLILFSVFVALTIIGLVVRKHKLWAMIVSASIIVMHFVLLFIYHYLFYSAGKYKDIGTDLLLGFDPYGLLSLRISWLWMCLLLIIMALSMILVHFVDKKLKAKEKAPVSPKPRGPMLIVLSWVYWAILLFCSVLLYHVIEAKEPIYSAYHYFICFISSFWVTILTMKLLPHYRIIAGIILSALIPLLPISYFIIYVLAIWLGVFYIIYNPEKKLKFTM